MKKYDRSYARVHEIILSLLTKIFSLAIKIFFTLVRNCGDFFRVYLFIFFSQKFVAPGI